MNRFVIEQNQTARRQPVTGVLHKIVNLPIDKQIDLIAFMQVKIGIIRQM